MQTSSKKRIAKKNQINFKRIFAAIVLTISIVTIVVLSTNRTAQAEESVSLNKYYRSIIIEPEDTMWDIAIKYNNGNDDIRSYISQIKDINNMINDDIRSGMNLVIYYYAE